MPSCVECVEICVHFPATSYPRVRRARTRVSRVESCQSTQFVSWIVRGARGRSLGPGRFTVSLRLVTCKYSCEIRAEEGLLTLYNSSLFLSCHLCVAFTKCNRSLRFGLSLPYSGLPFAGQTASQTAKQLSRDLNIHIHTSLISDMARRPCRGHTAPTATRGDGERPHTYRRCARRRRSLRRARLAPRNLVLALGCRPL